jgi:hypothetical protein
MVGAEMTRSLSWRPGRGATLTLVLLACLALSGGQALAATRIGHSGETGHYSFTDTTAAPGGRCVYIGVSGLWTFQRAKVKAPKIYWPTSSAFHSGTVGWLLKLQHWDGHAWHTVRSTPEARGHATKTTPAALATLSVHRAGPHDRKYRVLVKIRWMTPDAETIGSVLVRIDHLRRDYDNSVGSTCKFEVNL